MGPRVFISSTCYDLTSERSDIEKFIRSLGFAPVDNQKGTIPYRNEKRLEEYCYDAVKQIDMLVSIIGNNYGSESQKDNDFSISQMEVKEALKAKKQVFVFIKEDVLKEYNSFYKENKNIPNIKYLSVDNSKIYDFIDKIYSLNNNPDWGRINCIEGFKTVNDLKQYIKNQWAALLKSFLDEQTESFINFKKSFYGFEQLGIVGTVNKLFGSKFEPQKCMEETESKLYFMGLQGSKWVNDLEKLERFLSKCELNKGKVRFLMINPQSKSYEDLKNRRKETLQNETTKIFLRLVNKYSCLKVRYYDFIPNFRLTFVDENTLAVSKYAHEQEEYRKTKQGWDAPHLIIQKDNCDYSLYNPFFSYYEDIWDKSIKVTDLNPLRIEKSKIGVIHGRFQGLHHGHMEYLLEGKKRCDFLYIGITNPGPSLTKENAADLKRSEPEENPFTYYERMIMLIDAMVEAGIKRNEFEIVPFPINFPELIRFYVPMDALFFITIYDDWGEFKLETLKSLGVKTDLMWKKTLDERFTTGKNVRKFIAENESWEHLVPKSVAAYIKNHQLDLRIKQLKNGNI